jgi:hypothetical protein
MLESVTAAREIASSTASSIEFDEVPINSTTFSTMSKSSFGEFQDLHRMEPKRTR